MAVFYIFWPSMLEVWFAELFLPGGGLPFWWWCLLLCRSFVVSCGPFVYFCFYFLFGQVRKASLRPMSISSVPMFSTYFIVSSLIFKCLIRSELMLVYAVDSSLVSRVFSPLCVFGSFVENQLPVMCGCVPGPSFCPWLCPFS